MDNIFRDRFIEALDRSGKTQQELADATGISKAMITHYKNGFRNPKRDKVELIAKFLGVPATWLLGLDVQLGIKERESKLLKCFGKLNELGKCKAEEYIEDLIGNDKYIKSEIPDSSSKVA